VPQCCWAVSSGGCGWYSNRGATLIPPLCAGWKGGGAPCSASPVQQWRKLSPLVALEGSSTPREGKEYLVAHHDCVLNAGGGKAGWSRGGYKCSCVPASQHGVRQLFLKCACAAFFEKIWVSISCKIFPF
jgi:hypothetical protein